MNQEFKAALDNLSLGLPDIDESRLVLIMPNSLVFYASVDEEIPNLISIILVDKTLLTKAHYAV